ncbi:MAG: ATP-binding protein, partial [Schleiferiaceae bacterium]|nr:ATP-binding protein [Schleiferiaceae bacterium]
MSGLQAQVLIKNGEDYKNVGKDVSFYIDETNELTPEELLKKEFEQSVNNAPNFSVTEAAVWIKLKVLNQSDEEDFIFQIALPSLTFFEVYEYSENGIEKIKSEDAGQRLKDRPIAEPGAFLQISVPHNNQKNYLLKLKSSQNLVLPMKLGTQEGITNSMFSKRIFTGVFAGVFAIMFLYNLFVYFTVRDKAYLYYVIYLLFMSFTQLSVQGLTFKYLWPNNLEFGNWFTLMISNLGGATAVLFIQQFLDSKHSIPKLHKFLNVILLGFAVSIFLNFIGKAHMSFQIMQLTTMLGSVIGLSAGFVAWKDGYRSAIYFVVAWSVLLAGAVAFILKDFGVLPYNAFTENIFIGSSALEIVLLSFALGDKINVYKQEAFEAVQEKEQLLQEQNIELEKQVKSRTKELDEKNVILEKTLVDLKEAQAQLVQSEKMSSLGLLTAGIAHEINNPMNYARQSITTIKRDVGDLKELIDKFDEVFLKNKEVIAEAKEIEELKEDIELDYLNEEIEGAIDDVEDGIKRAVEIAGELKSFSRLDQANLKEADLIVGLNSTVELMKSDLQRHKIKVVKDYEEIPKIECLASKLNQVFMNIVNNGVYAITHSDQKDEGKLILGAKMDELKENIIISFEDNGMGMTEETKSKMFDPFFTKKDVGDGSGLGMSISHGIIEEHEGKFEVESE